jgi:predicted  nucleic acid-binding Zn-ribbon protein
MRTPNLFGDFNSAIIAALGALVFGALMKFVSKLTDKRKDTLNEHLELRRELREELDAVKHEINTLQKELDEWREKYYHQVEVTTLLQAELAAMRIEMSNYTSGEFIAPKDRDD